MLDPTSVSTGPEGSQTPSSLADIVQSLSLENTSSRLLIWLQSKKKKTEATKVEEEKVARPTRKKRQVKREESEPIKEESPKMKRGMRERAIAE